MLQLIVITVILVCSVVDISGERFNTLCYGRPTYITQQNEAYTCRLWQPNWASETVFELHFHHCQTLPTVSLFIRNFYGFDEINTYLNPKYKSFKVRLYTGMLARVDLRFQVVKADKKRRNRPSVHVKVYIVPNHKFSPEKSYMLTGIFYTDMKDDCNFFDVMDLHTKIIIGLVLIAILIIIPIVITLCRKWRTGRGTGNKKKSFCVWLFKCRPELGNIGGNDRDSNARNGLVMDGYARENYAGDGYARDGYARDEYMLNQMNRVEGTDRLID